MHEPELQSHERQWLFDLCDTDVPADFADSVVDASLPTGEPEAEHSASAVVDLGHRRRRSVVTGAVALAAILVLSLAALLVGRQNPRAERSRTAMQATTDALQRQCGDCHDKRSEEAKPGAVEAFDLSDPAWADGLTDAGLRALADRVDARDDIDPADRDRIETFVQAELDARRG
jgi:mono/diheme cytochrome c family protein